MAEQRRQDDHDASVALEPAPTARALHQRYAEEEALDREEALRLVALRDKALEEGLTASEQVERLTLTQSREDREPRLRRLQYEATIAQGDLDIAGVLASWNGLQAQKEAAYREVQRAIAGLYSAWQQVFHIHHEQELEWAKLPRQGSTLSSFPSAPELAQWITGRMPFGWGGILNDPHQHVWSVNWEAVEDVDPGTKPLHETTMGRIREAADRARRTMAQQAEGERNG
jgi:hypothetical protein